jgi:hypothetical protein
MTSRSMLDMHFKSLQGQVQTFAERHHPTTINQALYDALVSIQESDYPYFGAEQAALQAAADRLVDVTPDIYALLVQHERTVHNALSVAQKATEKANDEDEASLAHAESAQEKVESVLREAESVLEPLTAPAYDAIDALHTRHRELRRYAKFRDDGAVDFASGEVVLIANKAEWVKTGKGKQDPNGVLYLTDVRFVFEQKERSGGFMGVGSKRQQSVEIDVPLGEVTSVEAEDKRAGLGVKDLLTVTSASGDAYTLEVLDGADNADWVNWLERARSGDLPRATDDAPTMVELPPQPESAEDETAGGGLMGAMMAGAAAATRATLDRPAKPMAKTAETETITLEHTTVIDRGRHESETLTLVVGKNRLPVAQVTYGGERDGDHVYYQTLVYGGASRHFVQHTAPLPSGPLMGATVATLVSGFSMNGWTQPEGPREVTEKDGATETVTQSMVLHAPDGAVVSGSKVALPPAFLGAVNAQADALDA